jgi:hypothetical protein
MGISFDGGIDKVLSVRREDSSGPAPPAHGGGRRADPAVADDHRRHPLAELGQILRHADDVDIVMGMHIDKARRQHAPAINHLLRRVVQRRAIAIIRSPFTATSARYCGPPLPSITVTFLKSQSTFIAITPFRHADKLTIYKAKNSGKLRKNQIVL